MKRYKKYKPSGIEWIGEIPEHWDMKKLKYLVRTINEKPDHDIDLKLSLENIESKTGRLISPENGNDLQGELRKFQKGDVLFNKLRPYLAKAYLADQDGGCVGELLVLRSKGELIPEFLFYRVLSYGFIRIVDSSTHGSKMPRASWNDFISQLLIPYSQNEEQSAIANYLDRKTAQIHDLIAKKQELIDLLNEEKTAIINQAVSKGINPNAPMKDSGIPWLGKIPVHWDFKKLKYVAVIKPSNVDKKSYDGERRVFLCNYLDVYKNEFIDNSFSFMEATANENEINKFTIKKGDVLVTKDSETPDDIAKPAYIKQDLENVICGYHLAQIRANNIELIGEYLFRLFQTKKLNSHFEISANGITRFGLSVDSFEQVFVPLPPIKEQSDITRYIQTGNQRINVTISKIEREISLLHEYRTALISEAVTGKIKGS